MERFIYLAIGALVWIGLAGALDAPAHACSCGHRTSTAASVRNVPVLFAGRIEATETRLIRGEFASREIIATIQVSQRWKGNLPSVVQLRTIDNNNSCNVSLPVGVARVFPAFRHEDGSLRVLGYCSFHANADNPILIWIREEELRLNASVAEAPDSLTGRLARARFFEGWRDDERATVDYEDILRRSPENVEALLGLARMLRNRNLSRPQEFVVRLRQLSERLPNNPDVERMMSQARLAAGDMSALPTIDFRGVVLFRTDLSRQDLRGRDFSGARLIGVNFSGSDLRGAVFEGTDFADVIFQGADLRESRFVGPIDSPFFRGSDLRGALFQRISLTGRQLHQTSLREVRFDQVEIVRDGISSLESVDLSRAIISDSTLGSLSKVDLSGARLTNVVLDGVYRSNFDETILRNVSFGLSLVESTFRQARLDGVNFSRMDLRDVDFAGARITPRNAGLTPNAVITARENGADVSGAARPAGRPTRSAN